MKLMVKIGNHDGAIRLASSLPCDEFLLCLMLLLLIFLLLYFYFIFCDGIHPVRCSVCLGLLFLDRLKGTTIPFPLIHLMDRRVCRQNQVCCTLHSPLT